MASRRIIPQQRIEDNETNIDIFAYFSGYFKSSNLSGDGIVSIIPSSSTLDGQYQKTDASNLIMPPDEYRWCSSFDGNPKLTIKFHSNQVTLLSYAIEGFKGHRYIKSWKVYGLSKGKKYLLDSRINETVLGEAINSSIFARFECQNIGTFSTFSIESAGKDSSGDILLSMSSIQFYGIVNPYNSMRTCNLIRNTNQNRILYVLLILIS